MKTYKTIAEYIKDKPMAVRPKLRELKGLIESAVPEAEPTISYGMPAYRYKKKILAYFAAHAGHIGFYPGRALMKFEKELAGLVTGKGTIRFPLEKALPKTLIKKLVKQRASELDTK